MEMCMGIVDTVLPSPDWETSRCEALWKRHTPSPLESGETPLSRPDGSVDSHRELCRRSVAGTVLPG